MANLEKKPRSDGSKRYQHILQSGALCLCLLALYFPITTLVARGRGSFLRSLSLPRLESGAPEARGKMSSPASYSGSSPGPVSHVQLHANTASAAQRALPCGAGREVKYRVRGGRLQTSQEEVASGQAAWLFVMDSITWFELLWSGCFSGIFEDLILESLSTKECDKMPARGRGGGCLGCLCTPFTDRGCSRG